MDEYYVLGADVKLDDDEIRAVYSHVCAALDELALVATEVKPVMVYRAETDLVHLRSEIEELLTPA